MTDRQDMQESEARILDASGLVCPEPLMLLRNQVREMSIGERIWVTATDPTTHRDFSDYCRFLGHELVNFSQKGEEYIYLVEKKRP